MWRSSSENKAATAPSLGPAAAIVVFGSFFSPAKNGLIHVGYMQLDSFIVIFGDF
jgi:hypothetical protein